MGSKSVPECQSLIFYTIQQILAIVYRSKSAYKITLLYPF